jgi:hypothetical protein
MQEGQVIYYKSQNINEHEKRYSTNYLDLISIVYALKMWRHYLLERRFVLMIGQCGLKYLFDEPRLNTRQPQWMVVISYFDFEIKRIKGKENRVEDALSQSVQTIHLTTTSVGESNINLSI